MILENRALEERENARFLKGMIWEGKKDFKKGFIEEDELKNRICRSPPPGKGSRWKTCFEKERCKKKGYVGRGGRRRKGKSLELYGRGEGLLDKGSVAIAERIRGKRAHG